jgi:hypothetical protein
MNSYQVTAKPLNPVKYILLAALTAGTMDISAACIQYYTKTGKGPAAVLRFVASAVFGRPALKGAQEMAAYGLLFHYLIAFIWTLVFFWLYPHIRIMQKNRVVTGLIYGIIVWTIMNQVVLPLSNAPAFPFVLKKAAIAMSIIMVCIGLPIALIIGWYYKRKHRILS